MRVISFCICYVKLYYPSRKYIGITVGPFHSSGHYFFLQIKLIYYRITDRHSFPLIGSLTEGFYEYLAV
jgi:hypothetical protein